MKNHKNVNYHRGTVLMGVHLHKLLKFLHYILIYNYYHYYPSL